MRETLQQYCLRTNNPALLAQWMTKRNLPLSPDRIARGSKQKAWWRCKKGHEWQAAVHTRTGSGTGCPVCAGKVPLPGETDLPSQYPDLVRQWHPTRNNPLTPSQMLPGSQKMVWWVCEQGHEWQARIKSRVNGCGCPVCAGRTVCRGENDLASRFPAIAAQWQDEKNGTLRPDQVLPGSRRRVWWRCEKGHEWQAMVVARTSGGTGCPVCAGKKIVTGENDLATLFPKIAAQWHPTRNRALSPRELSPYANCKVWWLCPLGHAYQARILTRVTQNSGCPYCTGRRVLPGFNDLATCVPGVAAQWHRTLNGALTPEMVTPGSHRKVWWQCHLGHVWKAAVYSRAGTQKCGCPVCAGKVNEKKHRGYAALTDIPVSTCRER